MPEWTVRNNVPRSEDKSNHRWQHEHICGWMYRHCQRLMWQLIWNVSDLRALRHILFLLSQSFNLSNSLLDTSLAYFLLNQSIPTVYFDTTWAVRWMRCGTGETSRRLMWKLCRERRSKDAERQTIKNIKPLDGRMIIESGVMRNERWAGWGRRGVE